MEKLVLVSIRLPKSVIEGYENVVSGHYYWSRSDAMRNVLQNVLRYSDQDTFYRIIAGARRENAELNISVHDTTEDMLIRENARKEDSK